MPKSIQVLCLEVSRAEGVMVAFEYSRDVLSRAESLDDAKRQLGALLTGAREVFETADEALKKEMGR